MADEARARREENEKKNLCKFFTTKPESTANELTPNSRVFWSDRPLETDSDDDNWVIHDKIKTAFCNVYGPPLKGLLQFWAPVGGRQLLSTSGQPYVIDCYDRNSQKYRHSSLESQYIISSNDDVINGPVAAVYMNQFPEVVVDLGVHSHRGCPYPLVYEAIKLGFYHLILLPVFNQSSCVGVLECCMKKVYGLLVTFGNLKLALEKVGLSLYHVQKCVPYKTMPHFNHAEDEIEEALKIVCESFHLSLAQVWIANHVSRPSSSSSSSSEGTFVVKLCGYYCDDSDNLYDAVKVYYDTCDVLPLRMGEGVGGMTLEDTKEARFFTSLSKLRVKGLCGLLFPLIKRSCLAICLRSTHTGDVVDYAFEFLWPESRKHVILSESLLLTLKTCLPSFKFASGTQLGDELLVQDATRPNGSAFFKILKDNKLSEIPISLEQQEMQGPKFVKRKLCHLPESSYDTD